MTDYAAMSDAELNRAIAEKREYLLSAIDPNNWTVLDPDRIPITGYHTYPAQAWEAVPNWAGDVGEAMKLLEGADERNWKVERNTEETIDGSDIVTDYTVSIGRFGLTRESLTRAICEAWLAWKEGAG